MTCDSARVAEKPAPFPYQTMQIRSKLPLAAFGGAALQLLACGSPQTDHELTSAPATPGAPVASFDRMPSGVARNAEGYTFVAFPDWVERGPGLMRDNGDYNFSAWPDDSDPFRSVNGLHIDTQGRLWVLDNGRVDLGPPNAPPEVVVLDSGSGEELFRRRFDDTLAPLPGAFLNDVTVVEEHGVAVFTESGLGGESALIVWDYVADVAFRVLAGHPSLQADPAHPVSVSGEVVQIGAAPDTRPWLVGANGITSFGETVVFGATSSTDLWCADIAYLRDPDYTEPERCGDRPLFDGIVAISPEQARRLVPELATSALAFGVIATDIDRGWLSVIDPSTGRAYPLPFDTATGDGVLNFPVAIEPVPEGVLVTEGQFHLMPLLRGGSDARTPPFRLWLLPW